MEDKGEGLMGGDEVNLFSELEEGSSNMETEMDEHGGDDNYDDEDEGDELEAGSEIPNKFERLDYEALAEKKRKALADSQRDGLEKRAKYDAISTSGMDEFMYKFMSSGRRRKSRKNKKRGRRQGSKKEEAPEIQARLMEALDLHADGRDSEALPILEGVIKQEVTFDIAYIYLSSVFKQLGRTKSSTAAWKITAKIQGPKSPFWELYYEWLMRQNDKSSARIYASKAIQADPDNFPLKLEYADLCLNAGKYKEAAETYVQLFRRFPDKIEILKWGVEYFLKCGEGERAASILEDLIKSHSRSPDVLDLLACVYMQINAYDRSLKYIQDVRQIYNQGKQVSSSLKIRQAICHVRLRETELAEVVLSILPREAASEHPELIIDLADELTDIGNFPSALKYYLKAISKTGNNGNLFVKVARCYTSLAEREQAIVFYYKALNELSDPVDARITLASLLLENGKRDEAISVLSPPENPDPDMVEKQKAWWKKRKIRMNLCQMYYSEGMLEDFANTALQLVLKWVWRRTEAKGKRKGSVVSEHKRNIRRRRPRDPQASQLRGGARRWRKLRATQNEAKRISVKARNEDIGSESEEEGIKDEEYHRLFVDLFKALASLQRYWEALEIVNLARRLEAKMLPVEIKKELKSLGAKISGDTMDPKKWLDCVRSVIQQDPYRLNAWNCYYRVISRYTKQSGFSSEAKFMHHLRSKYRDCVPPILIAGHHFNVTNRHQDAAREYLEAYKLMPESPLINLCVGAALINLALGFRLKNRRECLAQGFAFLYKNIRICSNKNQEALYNVARAYQHVGLVTLAASYYHKVLALYEKQYPIPNELKPVDCDLRKEAAHNLHLIYKQSGAFDLARQILKDHCSF